jgi:hypothetical protein
MGCYKVLGRLDWWKLFGHLLPSDVGSWLLAQRNMIPKLTTTNKSGMLPCKKPAANPTTVGI